MPTLLYHADTAPFPCVCVTLFWTWQYLAYNSRKRQEGGDTAFAYFRCTEQVAGIQDTRFQALMPDALHWLGISKAIFEIH